MNFEIMKNIQRKSVGRFRVKEQCLRIASGSFTQ